MMVSSFTPTARPAFGALVAMILLLAGVCPAWAQINIGEDPVFGYARDGDTGAVRYFLLKGTDVEITRSDGETLLIIAASRGHIDLVDALIDAGARIDRADEFGRTPLSVAAEQGHYAIVERMLEKGANINHQMRDGLTPLMGAVKNRRLAIVQLLLKHRPNLSLLDYTGRGAVGWAQSVRDRRAESMLRRAGAVD